MLVLALAQLLFFTLFYFWGMLKNDYSVADIAWGLSFLVLFAVGTHLNLDPLSVRETVIGFCVLLWSLRLSGYIFYRNLKKGKEDERYTQMRKGWGKNQKLNAFFKIFFFQGLLSVFVGYPLFLLHGGTGSDFAGTFDIIGLSMFAFGFIWEAVADFQKNKFKSNPQNTNKLCQVGLWKYSRYPNYFGEILLWWGIIICISEQVSFYKVLWGPLLLSFFIIKVSGIAMLEEKYKSHPDYENYKNSTNTLIPGPAKGTQS
jgi:3-oxo-5-alpha-steroid 4-dehydrogenase 1